MRKALGTHAGDLPGRLPRRDGTARGVRDGGLGHVIHGVTEMPASNNRSLLRGGRTAHGVGDPRSIPAGIGGADTR